MSQDLLTRFYFQQPHLDTASSMPSVLIVDDMVDNLTILAELLESNYQVLVASSGERALNLARREPKPDLILLDVMMPDMDGFQVLTVLKSDPATQDIPVIFVTAMDSTEDEERGLECGVVDYITKPLRPRIVLARVHAQLMVKRANDLLRDQNLYLEQEVSRRMRENQLIQEVTIYALAHLAETRDPETGNHLRRTTGYLWILANDLATQDKYRDQLSPHSILMLTRSAPLHDIGKVGIPDQILLKPGPLTPEEWDVMKTHTLIGYSALAMAERDAAAPMMFLSFAKEIARHHHEKWDGSGYPDGLSGDAIPLSARLMALADVFDALISRRVYKKPMSFDEAYQIILEGKGKHFDPNVVDAFVRHYPDFVDIAKQYQDEELPA